MWKANGNTTTLLLFLDSLFPKIETHMRDASSGDKAIRRQTTPPFGSLGGERGVFLGEISSSKSHCSKKDRTIIARNFGYRISLRTFTVVIFLLWDQRF
jgi:hypothetical protein